MDRKVTLQSIADSCHFSKSMVAQVLRNPEGCKAKAETKALILETARRMDYYPSMTARALTTHQSYTIGVMFPTIRSFYSELMLQLDEALKKKGYYGLFVYWNFHGDFDRNFRDAFERVKYYGVDGIITCQYENFLADQKIPIVCYGNERPHLDCVYPDKEDYGKRVVRYLYEHGHRRIGCIGYLGDARYPVIFREMERLGLEIRPEWMIDSIGVIEEGCRNMKNLLKCRELPTALIVHSDRMVQGITSAVHEHGLRIPDDLSLISVDNLFDSAYYVPALTTFDQCYEKTAEILVETILSRIQNPGLPPRKYGFSMPLIERKSVRTLCPDQE